MKIKQNVWRINFYQVRILILNFRQQYKYEDITPARKEFLEKQDEKTQTKRQEADLSYWAQVEYFID